jgi:predicted NBD/HSP70 family sugar kinase
MVLSSSARVISAFEGHPFLTRQELQDSTGLSRVTISQVVQDLLDEKVLVEADQLPSNGGRKANALAINPSHGFIGICYFSATALTVAVSDLSGEIKNKRREISLIEEGPEKALPNATEWLQDALKGIPKSKLLGIVVGVPGPVEHKTGVVINPPIMRGWDGVNIREHFAKNFKVPVFLENDVNLMVIAEHRLIYPEIENLIFVKMSTGIGSGLIIDGRLYRGSQGSAGDIGHVQLDALKGLPCRCGHHDCVESFSSGWALIEKLKSMGHKIQTVSDLVSLARKGDAEVTRLLTEAASYIGHAIADAVNLLNPTKVVIQGRIAEASDRVLATIKEVVYQRASALASKNLEIVPSKLDEDRGVYGAAQLGITEFFFLNRSNA